jgi:signal recognition particle subunit SRP72
MPREAKISFSADLKAAATSLSRVTSLQHRPALVATVVKLYTQAGDIAAANACLDAAVAHWSKAQSADDAAVLRLLQQEAVSFKMSHKLYAEAATLLGVMLKQKDARQADILPQLVLACAHVNPAQAEQYAKQLPAFARSAVDVAALENAPSYRLGAPLKEEVTATATVVPSAVPAAAAKSAPAEDKKKKKRKRKKRLPKNFDPNKQPDPERWLPKRERCVFLASPLLHAPPPSSLLDGNR